MTSPDSLVASQRFVRTAVASMALVMSSLLATALCWLVLSVCLRELVCNFLSSHQRSRSY